MDYTKHVKTYNTGGKTKHYGRRTEKTMVRGQFFRDSINGEQKQLLNIVKRQKYYEIVYDP